jgi:replicative DNA helicase
MTAEQRAERALLGSLLIDPSAAAGVADLVSPDDFTDRKCRLVYEAILACADVDFVLVSCELEVRGTLDEVGSSFLVGLCLHTPTSLHAGAYARAVADAGCVRRAQAAPDRPAAAF